MPIIKEITRLMPIRPIRGITEKMDPTPPSAVD
jgi:hypothetical protein